MVLGRGGSHVPFLCVVFVCVFFFLRVELKGRQGVVVRFSLKHWKACVIVANVWESRFIFSRVQYSIPMTWTYYTTVRHRHFAAFDSPIFPSWS